MSPSGFFHQRREWSQWKHRILKRYLPKFSAILGTRHATIYFVDGFAGAGRYTDPPEDGSPVIAAQLAATPPANRAPYTLRCINVEPETFSELVAATNNVAPGLVENREGTFRQHLPAILETVGTSPTLFFLDPFGHKGMEWDVVTELAKRSASGKTTEVLLTFYIKNIDRHGGFIDSTHKAGPAFVKRLDLLFGTTEWQPLYNDHTDQDRRMQALTRLYMQRLADAFSGSAASYAVRTIEGSLKYHVIQATHAPIGCREMSDVVYRVSEEYRHEQARVRAAAATQLPLFSAREPTDEERNQAIATALAPEIHALHTKRARWTFVDIQDELMTSWFGRALEKHFRAACRILIAGGKATTAPTTKDPGRKSRGGIGAATVIELK